MLRMATSVLLAIVDPIVGGGGDGEMHSCHVSLRNRVFAVVGPNMAVHTEEPERLSTFGDASPSHPTTESIATLQRSQTCEFTAQSLHFRHAIQSDKAPQFSRRTLFEGFSRDPQKR